MKVEKTQRNCHTLTLSNEYRILIKECGNCAYSCTWVKIWEWLMNINSAQLQSRWLWAHYTRNKLKYLKTTLKYVRSDVLMAVKILMYVFWVVTLCGLVDTYTPILQIKVSDYLSFTVFQLLGRSLICHKITFLLWKSSSHTCITSAS
jgi:hypothetical protein